MKHLILIFSFLIMIGCLNHNDKSQVGSNDTSYVFQDSNKGTYPLFALVLRDNDSLAILGKFELNKALFLLDNKNGKIIKTFTVSYNDNLYPDFYKKIGATKIKIKANDNQNYIAYFGFKPNDYKLIIQKPINSVDLVQAIDTLIRKSGFLDTILQNETFVKDSLRHELPKLVKITLNDTDITFATYMLMGMNGPRFAIIRNNVFPLTHNTACSYDYLNSFYMAGKYYIETGSACCGCGITGKQIFEINNDTVISVFEDFTLSN